MRLIVSGHVTLPNSIFVFSFYPHQFVWKCQRDLLQSLHHLLLSLCTLLQVILPELAFQCIQHLPIFSLIRYAPGSGLDIL